MSREDKKRKVSPYVPTTIKRHVHELAVQLRTSDGDAGTRLTMTAMNDFGILQRMGPYLSRSYAFGSSLFVGHRHHENLDELINPGGEVLERLPMRFIWDDWSLLDALGFALGRPVAHAAAALLRLAYAEPRIAQAIAPGFHTRSEYAFREETAWDSLIRPSASRG